MTRTVKNASELRIPEAYEFMYEEQLEDCNGVGIALRHRKSGARLALISCEDENKVFYIGFRTPPKDDTGVAHIIEHSVLCGSDKFRVKDPFMEMARGSLNTFMNAFTYPDKTMYPIASCNDKDFANLMDVYMDAVLHPLIYRSPNAFRQEGWHYELMDKAEPITINGIVYSEMKGAFSNPDDVLMRSLMNAKFPDNAYGVESGGDPDAIPDLTYENYLAFHSKFYHPSNAYIYLYGDMDLTERLEWLDQAYLSAYDKIEVDSDIAIQAPVGLREITGYYPIGDEDSDKNCTYLAAVMGMGTYEELETNMALDAVIDVVINASSAPVRRAIMEAGIGADISCSITLEMKQPFITLTVKNAEADQMEELKEILKRELKKQVEEGINKESMRAYISRAEFYFREAEFGYFPKGLKFGVDALDTWLYDDKAAFARLHNKTLYPKLYEKLETRYYEELIEKYLLSDLDKVYYTLIPKRGINKEKEEALAKKLADYKASLSDEELDRIIEETKALKAYQEQETTPEEAATMPRLARSEIKREALPLVNEVTEIAGVKTVYNEYDTNGIAYYGLAFDMDILPVELIPYFSLAIKAIGDIDTENYTLLDMENAVNLYTGSMVPSIIYVNHVDDASYYRPMFEMRIKNLTPNTAKALELMKEQLLHNEFGKHTDRIKELVGETKARVQTYFVQAGHQIARNRALSYISDEYFMKELTFGVDYYDFICDISEHFDERAEEIAQKMSEALLTVLGQDNMLLNICCSRAELDEIRPLFEKTVAEFPAVVRNGVEGDRRGPAFEKSLKNEGLKIAGQVQYVISAGSFADAGEYPGAMEVARNAVNDYLYQQIRVLGGAYGGGCSFNLTEKLGFFYSYRDPKLAETFEVYKTCGDYVRNFEADEETITRFVIGTIGQISSPLSPSAKGMRSYNAYMSGITFDSIQKRRNQIIDADAADIRAVAGFFDAVLASGANCVVGNENKIAENASIFGSTRNLA